ncbi:hypothetical protein NUW54_g1457 [Trametes sanguinea]|uniref:Uncharacterized protein n=1 Tax=Trametes sanguinea TaxID=158606 RepID=A0ACC1Q994_9APHY|nr:hypothetical protein NUW54_g1457 [Trametes sanguinea]
MAEGGPVRYTDASECCCGPYLVSSSHIDPSSPRRLLHVLQRPPTSCFGLLAPEGLTTAEPLDDPHSLQLRVPSKIFADDASVCFCSPRDADGADVPPVRPADGPAADDLSQSADILSPSHANWRTDVVLQGFMLLRDVLRRMLWTHRIVAAVDPK